ncbi:MAG: alanine racemase [Propionibacteriaceae bacterium]|jgi:alanine racemase|nr:alanine racemase [Propionibacteriaceae bacterium]
MGVVLHLDQARWRAHLDQVAQVTPGLTPVAKGNGYGFGVARLASEATRLGVETLAVGTLAEAPLARAHFTGRILILQPWRPDDPPSHDPGLIRTVSRLEDLARLADQPVAPQVVVELMTSITRHGIGLADLNQVPDELEGVELVGWALHLPLPAARHRRGPAEALELGRAALAVQSAPVWLSHLSQAEYDQVRAELGDCRLRLGTRLWLGAPESRRVTASVIDRHPVRRGQRVGYWQHKAPADGHIVVLAGGTSHGVGLSAPSTAATWRRRGQAVAEGLLAAAGRVRSPFTIAGAKRRFVEPPHMQVSLVFLPSEVPPPAIGDEIPLDLRLTTATLDQIHLTEDDSTTSA